jgi:tRNA threonylcarbamoyl adenosine modification protein (Sua5/YciO/YrdC/YwlC family)
VPHAGGVNPDAGGVNPDALGVNPVPAAARRDEAVAALRAGLVVLLPTDTVYGLAVDPSQPGATDRLFRLKARPIDAPLPVLAADAEQVFELAEDVPVAARLLAQRLWPGGLTLVLARRLGLDLDLGGPDDATIGVRVPDDDLVRGLAREVGPLATTSANRHGLPTPATADDVLTQLGDGGATVAVVLDGGPRSGLASTVVRCDEGKVTIIREGRVPAATILAASR